MRLKYRVNGQVIYVVDSRHAKTIIAQAKQQSSSEHAKVSKFFNREFARALAVKLIVEVFKFVLYRLPI